MKWIILLIVLLVCDIFSKDKIYISAKQSFHAAEDQIKIDGGIDYSERNIFGYPILKLYAFKEYEKDVGENFFKVEWILDVKSGLDKYFYLRYQKDTERKLDLINSALYWPFTLCNTEAYKRKGLSDSIELERSLFFRFGVDHIYNFDWNLDDRHITGIYNSFKWIHELNEKAGIEVLIEATYLNEFIKSRYEVETSFKLFKDFGISFSIEGLLFDNQLTHESKIKLSYYLPDFFEE